MPWNAVENYIPRCLQLVGFFAATFLCVLIAAGHAQSTNANLIVNGDFTNGLSGWSISGNVSTSDGFSLTRDSTVRSVLFQTVQHEGLPLNLSLDFVYAVLSDSVPPGTFADTAYLSIYESTNASTLRPDLDQFDAVRPIFDAYFSGFTNLAPGVSIAPSPRGPVWWTLLFTNYVPTYDYLAVTLEVYNFNGITNDSTAPMTAVVFSSVPEPQTVVLFLCGLLLVAAFQLLRSRVALMAALALVAAGNSVLAQSPASLGSRVRVATANETSAFDRATRVITQIADVTVTNIGDRPVKAPLRVRVALTGEGDLSRVMLTGVQLGDGEDARPFYDLSGLLPVGGLAPNTSLNFQLRLTRPSTTTAGYQLEAQGVFNRDPVAAFDAPLVAVAGEEIAFDAAGSNDGDGGSGITYAWNFGDGGASDAAAPRRTFAKPGRYDIVLTVSDGENAKSVLRKTVTVLPSANFAVARTRTLDASGQPLGAVRVRQRRGEEFAEMASDGSSGFVALGGEPGEYIWRFSREGCLPVWRKATLATRQILFVPSPWLVPQVASDQPVSPLRGLNLGGDGRPATVVFPAGAFTSEGSAGFTAIGPQALPLPLPAGWSPLGAFHLALPAAPAQVAAVTWRPSDKVVSDDVLAMLKYDTELLQWTVIAMPPANASPAGEVSEAGTYALVVADKGARAPPAAVVGSALPPATDVTFDSSSIIAAGSVAPAKLTARLDAASMTASGRVVFTGASDLPSGAAFRTEIEEEYQLADGRMQRTPVYDTSFFSYQRPGDADAKTLHAVFPLRPTRLLDPAQVDKVEIEADILTGDSYAASLFDESGGRISAENVAVMAGEGDLSARSLAELRLLELSGFEVPLAGRTGVAAFQVAVGNLAAGRGLEVELSGMAANKDFVVARYVARDSDEGLEPVERLRSDAAGNATSVEPASGERLPGVAGPGQYVVVAVDGPQAVVSGVARNLAGNAVAGLAVRIAGLPWLTFSASDGAYKLVAPQGAASLVTVADPADGNSGSQEVVIAAGEDGVTADVRAATTAPRVVSTSPADKAQKVRASTPVTVRFSEPIDPTSFAADALTLTGPDDAVVLGSLSLNAAGIEASFLPTNPLSPGATYTIEVSPLIKDRQALALEGPTSFSFTIVPSSDRPPGAELVIYEPGADNIPSSVRSQLVGYSSTEGSSHVVAYGSAGTADPEVPVILVNQNSGETATVLSKPDGSFASFISAAEEDFIEAVFVNANGTRVTVPATKQIYDNGRIGLYKFGGILEAESDGGEVQVIVEPGAIMSRTVFKIERLFSSELLAALNGVLPAGDAKVLAGASIAMEGDQLEGGLDIVMPIEESELDLPEGVSPAEAAFATAQQIEVDGRRVYQMLSQGVYSGGALRTVEPSVPAAQSAVEQAPVAAASGRQRKQSAAVQAGSGPSPLLFMKLFPSGPVVVSGRAVVRGDSGALDEPVPGAIVSWQQVGYGGGRPLEGGDLVAVADRNGGFRLLAPQFLFSDGPLLLNGYSPRFPGQIGTGSSSRIGSGTITAAPSRVFFSRRPGLGPVNDTTAPKLQIALANPTVSPAADKPFTVVVSGEDDSVSPSLQVTSPATFKLLDTEEVGTSRRDRYSFTAPAGIVRVTATAADQAGNTNAISQDIAVAATAAGAKLIVDPDDEKPPFVVGTHPRNGTVFAPFADSIELRFSEPINSLSVSDLANGAVLTPSAGVPHVQINSDNTLVTLRYPLMQLGTSYTLTLSHHHYRDLAGNAIDQDGVNVRYDNSRKPFVLSFNSVGRKNYQTLQVDGGGIASTGNGKALFALDRNPASLAHYKIMQDGGYELAGVEALAEFPRDVVVIDGFDLAMPPDPAKFTRDPIVVVCGGTTGFFTAEGWQGSGPWVTAFALRPDGTLHRLAGLNFPELGPTLFLKLVYDRGKLGILTSSVEDTSVQVLDLQPFLWSMRPSSKQTPARKGADINSDGDYGDLEVGEIVPIPEASPQFGFLNRGLFSSLTPPGPERLEDFDLGRSGRFVCAVTREPATETYRLRLLASSGATEETSPAATTLLPQRAKRVKILLGTRVVRNQELGFADLILVSSETELLVYEYLGDDKPLRLANRISFPRGAGIVQSIQRVLPALGWGESPVGALAQGYGMERLAVATTQDVYYLDPSRLLETPVDLTDAQHPSIVGRALGLGSGARSFVALANGTLACALGGKSFINTGLRDEQFSVASVAAYDINQPEKTAQPVFTNLVFSNLAKPEPPPGPVTRKSRPDTNGVEFLEIIVPASKASELVISNAGPGKGGAIGTVLDVAKAVDFLKGLTNKPTAVFTADAEVLPANVSQGSYPTWRWEGGNKITGSGVSIPVEYKLPAGLPSWNAFVAAPDVPIYHVLNIDCEGRPLRIHVYPPLPPLEKKLDLSPITTRATQAFEQFSEALKIAGAAGPVPVSGEIKVELAKKAEISFKASFFEHPENNLVLFAPAVEIVQDPLIGVTGTIKFGKDIPKIGALYLFIEASGKVSLRGKIERLTESPRVGAWAGSLALKGEFGLGVGGRAVVGSGYNSSTPVAVEVSAKGTVTVEGKVQVVAKNTQSYDVKGGIGAQFDGIKGELKITLKYLGGEFTYSPSLDLFSPQKIIDPPFEKVLGEFQFN